MIGWNIEVLRLSRLQSNLTFLERASSIDTVFLKYLKAGGSIPGESETLTVDDIPDNRDTVLTMQAPTLSRCVEQRNLVGPCFPAFDSNGNYAASRTAVHLRSVTERFVGCSYTQVTTGYSSITARTRQSSGRKLFLFPGKFGGPFHLTTASELRLLLGLHGSRTKAQWRSPRNYWKQALDKEPSVFLQKCFDALDKLASRVQNCAQQIPVQQIANADKRWRGSTLTAIALSLMVLAAPGPTLTDSSLTLSNSARADQLGQLRQAASVFEKAAEGLSKVRFDGDVGLQVLDKAVTLVTGSTSVDPEVLDKEVDALLSGEKDFREELMNGIKTAVENSWSTVIDVVTNFNPGAISESAGASMSTFLEAGAERVAAFELSALVSIGERWLIITPLIFFPMAWEMKRLRAKSEKAKREGQEKLEELNEQAKLRGEKVRRELERIELRALVLDAVSSLGKMALQPPRSREEAGLIRRRIKDMLERLEDLNPVKDSLLLVPEFASASAVPNDGLAHVPVSSTVDGDWSLIYVSEATQVSDRQGVPQFQGFGLDNLRQNVWQAANIGSLAYDSGMSPPRLARNTAEIRLGPLGVFQVGVQGSWENFRDGQKALVSFNRVSARPLEILGSRVNEEIPELSFSLPSALQRSAEWAVAYVDAHLRINRGAGGQLFLFRKIE